MSGAVGWSWAGWLRIPDALHFSMRCNGEMAPME